MVIVEWAEEDIYWVPSEGHSQVVDRQAVISRTVFDAVAVIKHDKQHRIQFVDRTGNIRVGDEDVHCRDGLGNVVSICWRRLQVREARRAMSSAFRTAPSSCWSRCWCSDAVGSTNPAAAPWTFLCSQLRSSMATPWTAAAGQGTISRSEANSPTARLGGC